MANSTKLAVILHADIVGSTALVQSDERLAHDRIQDVFRRFSETISGGGGTTHEIRGDALVAEFERASDAAIAALAFQAENQVHNETLVGEVRPELRIGIALGEVVIADRTVTGAGVVLAQRLEQLASPGKICISAAIREAVPGRLSLAYDDLGEHELKGFAQLQHAYLIISETKRSGSSSETTESSRPTGTEQRASIAVLPFSNLSSDPEQEHFADGMAEDIITALSKFNELLVIARNTTFTFKGQAIDVANVGKQLQVRYIVEGSVRRAGNRIRITAQLIDVASGSHLWAERFDRSLDDVFTVQDEVTAAIVAAVAPEIHQAEVDRARRMPPNNLDAWALYQKGLSLIGSGDEEDCDAAQALFDAARTADPSFTDAQAMAAYMRARRLIFFASQNDDSILKEAEAVLKTALRQGRNNPNCLLARGYLYLYLREYDLAAASLREAVALNPNFALAYSQLGFVLNQAGCAQEGLDALDVADRLNPRDPVLSGRLTTRAVSHFMLGQFEESAEFARRASRSENPRYWVDAILVAVFHRLERNTELEVAKKTLFQRRPKFSISDVAHFFRPELIEALKDAGLPQK